MATASIRRSWSRSNSRWSRRRPRPRWSIRITDEGEGFDPVEVADPLAPENLLRSSGRGIFFMRSFMDDVTLQRRPAGGMEVLMTKRLPSAEPASA